MLVSRINPYSPYSFYPSYTKNNKTPAIRANQTDSVSFKGKYLRELPEIMKAANAVLRKMDGKVLEVHVPKLRTTCKASPGNFNGTDHLCLCFDKEGQSIRYRISLNDNGETSLLSDLVKERLSSKDAYFAQSTLDLDVSSIPDLTTLLQALRKNKNRHEWNGFPINSFPPRKNHPKQLSFLYV